MESYNLRWGDFHANLRESFEELRLAEELLDVSLCVDEERSLRAHRVVLSASSPYFRRVLRRHAHRETVGNNLVVLMPPGTSFHELSLLLEFVYCGEVSVSQAEIDSFMSLAKSLQIKGLTPTPGEGTPEGLQSTKEEMEEDHPSHERRAPSKEDLMRAPFHAPNNNRGPRGQHKRARYSSHVVGGSEGQNEGPSYYEEGPPTTHGDFYSEVEPKLNTGTKLMGLICPSCRTLCHDVPALKDHMAHACPGSMVPLVDDTPLDNGGGGDYVQQESVICNICDKTFKSQKSMLGHQRRLHKLGLPEEGSPIIATAKKRGRPSKKSLGVSIDEEMKYVETLGRRQQQQQGPMLSSPHGDRSQGPLPPEAAGPEKLPPPSRVDTMARSLPTHSALLPRGPARLNAPPNQFRKSSPVVKVGRPPNSAPVSNKTMDLQKIGLKLGGQISITSSENDGPTLSGGTASSSNKLTITKLKGDDPVGSPLSIKEATSSSRSTAASTGVQCSVEVKEEPSEDYVDGNNEDGEDAYADEHYEEEEEDNETGGFNQEEGGPRSFEGNARSDGRLFNNSSSQNNYNSENEEDFEDESK